MVGAAAGKKPNEAFVLIEGAKRAPDQAEAEPAPCACSHNFLDAENWVDPPLWRGSGTHIRDIAR